MAQFQASQRHGDADGANDDGGDSEAHMVRAQREPDREVVDAQGNPGEQQPPGSMCPASVAGLALVAVGAGDGLHEGIHAGGDELHGADPVGSVAENAG